MAFAAVASGLSAAFAVVVFLRFLRSRRPAFAAWTLGLLIFAGAAAFQAAGETGGWSPAVFRGFYLLGGVLGVIYLALGTVFLLAPRRVAWAWKRTPASKWRTSLRSRHPMGRRAC